MVVRVIVDGVLGVIVDVLIGLDEVRAIYVAIFVVIFCNWRYTLYTLGLLPLGLRVLDAFRLLCCMKEFGDGFDDATFPRFFISWRKLQLSPFTHFVHAFCSLILDHGVLLKISISVPKIIISNFLLDTSLHHSFQSVTIRS